MLWEFIELPPFDDLRDSLFSDNEFSPFRLFCGIILKPAMLFLEPADAANCDGQQRAKGNEAEPV